MRSFLNSIHPHISVLRLCARIMRYTALIVGALSVVGIVVGPIVAISTGASYGAYSGVYVEMVMLPIVLGSIVGFIYAFGIFITAEFLLIFVSIHDDTRRTRELTEQMLIITPSGVPMRH
jgi:hypothetical protein